MLYEDVLGGDKEEDSGGLDISLGGEAVLAAPAMECAYRQGGSTEGSVAQTEANGVEQQRGASHDHGRRRKATS
ncbi:hypothetical protein MG293_016387 [Ovis ammon polii]|uniref:Uncharacterized protein n=1 Tax=Ovis ammon polii TaxID=230172 RepID=A0AAD4Y3M2_OVIAM|nr:hypothetical protein MG293_016387 [Ovis ammon polii]KAI4556187.1 hypothetical protein MJT46_014810 [Ovis ammon polii x Ovis aries]